MIRPHPFLRLSVVAVALLMAGFLPAPASAGSAPLRSLPNVTAPSNLPLVIAGFTPPAGIRDLGPLPNSTPLTVDVALQSSDSAGLESYATSVASPGSPRFHQYLTPAETAARFGSAAGGIAAATAYFHGFGLSVGPSPDSLFLTVSGRSVSMGSAFHTSFERYSEGARTFFSHPTAAVLPPVAPWYGALGLGDQITIHPRASALPAPAATVSCGNFLPLVPCDIARAYGFESALASGENGTGYRIGIVDPFDSSEAPAQLQSDLHQFTKQYSLAAPKLTFEFPTGSESSLNGTSPTGWAVEDATDLQWAHASAPGATIVFALTPYTNPGIYGAVDSLVANRSVDVLSLSWGEPDVGVLNAVVAACNFACNASSDGSYALLHPVLEAAAIEGIGVFAASGDCGASDGTSGLSTDYPSSDPFATGVGGTALTVASDGSYSSETGWSGNTPGNVSPGCFNQGGSGGGFAPFPRPPWQSGPGLPSSPASRGNPDVSLNGATPVAVMLQGGFGEVIGTSIGTPVWAGLLADADSARHTSLGFLDPSLYAILRGSQYPSAFHDITSGSNGYSAGPGWDPITGIGTPVFSSLLPLLGGGTPPFGTAAVRLNASVQLGPAPLTVQFQARATGGTGSFAEYDFSFGDGNATLSTIPSVSYTYRGTGAFSAEVTVLDSGGNSTISAPIAIAPGGSSILPVLLTATAWSVPIGTSIRFSASTLPNVSGVVYTVEFGDGTYSLPSTDPTATHLYRSAGGFCAGAIATSPGSSFATGNSTPISISVGGAVRPLCAAARPIVAHLSTNLSSVADLPGDFSLRWNVSGGLLPLEFAITADDPYAALCGCTLFRSPGSHLIRGFANDSIGDSASPTLAVTLYPALVGNFTASRLTGAAPLSVLFTAGITGGHGSNLTTWSFGDGTNANGSGPLHTFVSAGYYLVVARSTDSARGNATGAFLIDATPPGATSTPALGATISPATFAGSGALFHFQASSSSLGPGTTLAWNFSDGTSAFGPQFNETFGADACGTSPGCALVFSLRALSAGGTVAGYSGSLLPLLSGRWSALTVNDSGIPVGGSTPFAAHPLVTASGMPGIQVAWRFGDGTTATGNSEAHYYLAPGNLTLSETVTDSGGDSWVRHHAIAIRGTTYRPLAIVVSPTIPSGVAPVTTGFVLQFPGGGVPPFSYAWSFGDGNRSTLDQPLHTYSIPGSYAVSVSVLDSIGENSTATTMVSVYQSTPVSIVVEPPARPVSAHATFVVRVVATPSCGAGSVPSCGRASVPSTLTFLPPAGSSLGQLAAGLFQLSVGNATLLSIVAPGTPGEWSVSIATAGPNYTGSGGAPLDVVTVAENTTGLLILLGGGVGGVAVALAVALLSGRRSRSRIEGHPDAAHGELRPEPSGPAGRPREPPTL